LNVCATTINAFGAATSVNMMTGAGALEKTVRLATGASGKTDIEIGTDASGSVAIIRGRNITLGAGTGALTKVTIGGAITGNTLHISSASSGLIKLTTDHATTAVEAFTNITSGVVDLFNSAQTVNLSKNAVVNFTAGKDNSTFQFGGASASLYVGTTVGTIDTKTAASTANVFNTNATTVNAFGAATSLTIGGTTGTLTARNQIITFTNAHTLNLNGASSGLLTVAGSSATSLNLFNATQATVNAFQAGTSISIGATTGTFGIRNLTFNLDNAKTFGATKLETINLGTASASNVATTIGIAGKTNTLNLNGSTITVGTGSTGTVNLFKDNATIINAFQTANTINVGKAATTFNLDSTNDATSLSAGALVVDGGVAIAKQLRVGKDTTLGSAATDTTTISGKAVLSNNSQTYPLQLGADVNLYRSAANVLTIDDHLHINGVSNTANITSAATTNLLTTTNTLKIGADGSTTTINGHVVVKNSLEVKGRIPYLLFVEKDSHPTSKTDTGILYYQKNADSLTFVPSDTDVELNIGQEEYVRVHNTTGSTIPNGSVLAGLNTSTNGVTDVVLAKANQDSTSRVFGVATHDIPAGEDGFATTHGLVHDFPVGSLTPGIVYLSHTVAGGVTNTAPPEGNHCIVVGLYTNGTESNLYVDVHQSWTTKAVYNNLHAKVVEAYNEMQLPTLSTAPTNVTGSIYWDSNNSRLKVRKSGAWQEFVDLNSTQSLVNKTYNALTLKANTVGFEISGGTTSKKLTLGMDLTVQTGKVVLTGASGGSSALTLPNNTTTINALTANHVLYASAANTISGEAQLAVSRGGTGVASMDANYFYKGNGSGVMQKSNVQNTASQVTFDANTSLALSGTGSIDLTHSSTNKTAFSVTASGAKTDHATAANVVFTATSSTGSKNKKALNVESTGTWNGSSYAIFSKATGGTNNYSFYGDDGLLYNKGDVTFAGDLAVNGGDITSTTSTMNMFAGTVTTLNMLGASNATLNIGGASANSNVRTTNIYSQINVGTSSYKRNIDLYGDMNVGGPSGFKISWNDADSSLDFVKL
jgi:hypothetical protein